MIVTTREVTREECPWLPRDLVEGEEVFRYYGYTYGCISPTGVAVSLDGQDVTPFLEVPRDAIGYVDAEAA